MLSTNFYPHNVYKTKNIYAKVQCNDLCNVYLGCYIDNVQTRTGILGFGLLNSNSLLETIWNFAHLQNVINNIIWVSIFEIRQIG